MCENIIYIDDNEYEHFHVEILVKQHSTCALKCFLNGREALDVLVKSKGDASVIPDVIFLDLSMPDFTGWDFLEEFAEIRVELCKQPHVYILSSTNDDDSVSRSTSYPFVKRFLPKPLTHQIFEELNGLD